MTRPLRKLNECIDVNDCKDALNGYKIAIAQANWETESLKDRVSKHSLEQKEGVAKILEAQKETNNRISSIEKTFNEVRLRDTEIYAEDKKNIWEAIHKNHYKMILLISLSGGSGAFAAYKLWSSISGLFS